MSTFWGMCTRLGNTTKAGFHDHAKPVGGCQNSKVDQKQLVTPGIPCYTNGALQMRTETNGVLNAVQPMTDYLSALRWVTSMTIPETCI
jgi:hypothetical protein